MMHVAWFLACGRTGLACVPLFNIMTVAPTIVPILVTLDRVHGLISAQALLLVSGELALLLVAHTGGQRDRC
jgi:hypothetical protein